MRYLRMFVQSGDLWRFTQYFGSLYVQNHEEVWTKAAKAILSHNTESAREIIQEIIVAAIPEEGSPHPQRATLKKAEEIIIETPGGVSIHMYPSNGYICLDYSFGRDSRRLAGILLCEAFILQASRPPNYHLRPEVIVEGHDEVWQAIAKHFSHYA